MKFKEQYIARCEGNEEVVYWIEHNLTNYITHGEREENMGEIEHILDYLLSNAAPKRLRSMSYSEAKDGADKWTKALSKKGRHYVENEDDIEIIDCPLDNGFTWVKLKSERAYQREGKLQSNCVASYYGKKHCDILSLRDKNNNPHATIELIVADKSIEQIKGKGNGEIHPKYAEYILQLFNSLDVKVREYELSNMGYYVITSTQLKTLNRMFDGVKILTFQNKYYYYKYSDLSIKL